MKLEEFWNDNDIIKIHERIKNKKLRVILPEGEEDRIIGSLKYLKDVNVVLLGNEKIIKDKLNNIYGTQDELLPEIEIIDKTKFARKDLLELFMKKRHGKISEESAKKLMENSNYFATLLLEADYVDSLVGGCMYSTADILKPAFQIIKPAIGNSIVSSCFILKKNDEKLIFADCAVNIEPNKNQLKEIVRQTIQTAIEMGIRPKVAMLSYSTKGSGTGHYVDLVRNAYEELIEEREDFKDIIDGELQFDAAYVEAVGNLKAPNSPVAGKANVFVFPHLNSGNIACKMAQYLGGYEAVGPLLQGLNKPVNDLSRGTDEATIAKVIYLSLRKY